MSPAGSGVHVGRNGWLFWVGRSGEVVRLYGDTLGHRWLAWRWRRLIEARSRRAARLGAAFRQVVVPDKLSVLGLDEGAPNVDRGHAPGRRIGRSLADGPARASWVDLFGVLDRVEPPSASFLKTDTHLTRHGYLVAYRAICAACTATPAPSVEAGTAAPLALVLDLGGKVIPPVAETIERPALEPNACRIEANALTLLRERRVPGDWAGLQQGSRTVHRCEGDGVDDRIAVVFGDSYCFNDGALGAMLAETFRELHLVWSSEIDWDYVAAVRPALVIGQMAERFLRKVPRDRLRVEAFAAERVRRANART